MSSTINTNVASLNAQRNLSKSSNAQATAMERLSSGLRINSAKDDSAGLSITQRMTSQINGMNQAARNANDGISLAQTAEGDLSQIGTNLQRMRELAVQSANATNTASDRKSMDEEVQQLSQEIDRIAQNSSFNGVKLLDGSFVGQSFQIGANGTSNDVINVGSIVNARTSSLGGSGTSTKTTVNGTATTTAIVAGDLTLNGIQVGASTTGSAAGQSAASAFSIAAAINNVSAQSGVTATANKTSVTGAAATAFGAVAAGSFTVNGISVGAITAGDDAAGQGANVAAAINLVSAQSGVTAAADASTGKVTLSAADGRDIALAEVGAYNSLAADTGLSPATTHGTITLSTNSATGVVISGDNEARAGLTAGTTTPTTTLTVNSISSIDVLTTANASNALAAIDGALNTINSARGTLGAYQNRFSSVVSTLQTTSENLSASRSRIQDTDFAQETAALSRSQVLQQAGTAMLAQANSAPQGVLSLLR
jgi:flagellin